jgi:hypothetical protein
MRAASQVPYLVLLPERFAMPRFLRRERWSLKPPFHPYPYLSARAVSSLWHCLSASPYVVTSRVYLRPDRSYAAPRPMEFGLSSRNLRCERPSALPRRVQGGGWMRVWRVGNFLGACLKMGGLGLGNSGFGKAVSGGADPLRCVPPESFAPRQNISPFSDRHLSIVCNDRLRFVGVPASGFLRARNDRIWTGMVAVNPVL